VARRTKSIVVVTRVEARAMTKLVVVVGSARNSDR